MVPFRFERVAALGAALLAAVSGGCSFDNSGAAGASPDAAGGGGSLVDSGGGLGGRADAAPLDAADDQCAGWTLAQVVDACDIAPALRRDTLTLEPGVYTYDTDDGVLLRQGGGQIDHHTDVIEGFRIVSAATIDIQDGSELRAVGDRPLLLVSWGDLDVGGAIDVSSHAADDGGRGAGGNPEIACTAGGVGPGAGLENDSGGGGGGGGGFGSAGGVGGDGDADTAGLAGDLNPGPTRLRGGCTGGAGGVGASGVAVDGGVGGGAVALFAYGAITVNGLIHAGGGGGEGAATGTVGGGGGGGSGGLVWLSGQSIALSSSTILAANGGGGGEGSDEDASGDPGDDAPETGLGAAGGETGLNTGGNGGSGSNGGADGQAGVGGTSASGGGGGGGGAGRVELDSDDIELGSAFITPPPRL